MKPMHGVSAAVLLAALLSVSGAPAFAATMDHAKVTIGTKTDLVPVSRLVEMIGTGAAGDLAALDKAGEIKTYDTKTLYPAADQAKIASAETTKASQLGKLRDSIRGDAALKAWFETNHIDVNRVVAVGNPSGHAEVFLY
ncbi:MAG: hypothetical protein P0Y65_03420 [Candidatus Devosia phytovorans]|uniref:Uncharacterized protein n=1 Tax=Candidatus Devosia phytovorans TaxID=3121372 RepID=A0AAJ5VVU0_9HYPH|nr:hypothetical protein [Devosia sp.]WEK05322.1 MAG: hypothetical protein P0Y65_03420 [Devosia sp.]